jgi:cation diffusion facilitator CzcD-associated flavoprotein CzcO
MAEADHVDVLIIGAGISGVGAAAHLQERSPGKSYAILESKDDLGGTWNLFRYPGIRSDSDMHTLGYRFKPWTAAQSIADGDSILDYVRETARERGIDRHIRFNHKATTAAWSSAESRWTVEAARSDTGETVTITCDFLFLCSGYFRHDRGFTPEFPGIEDFGGQVIHPQHWPEDLDYEGKKVVVVGSGATAVTLVPALAEKASKVTMLQRSPTYVVSMPGEDAIAIGLRRFLPEKAAYALTRWKNVLLQSAFYRLCRRFPGRMKGFLVKEMTKALPPGYDVGKHFTPKYNPWDQRVCLVPNGDLFDAIAAGSAEVATDTIKGFDATGIELDSGERLEADIVVTATGLNLLFLGEVEITVDGRRPDIPNSFTYKGMMLNDVPNLAFTLGYTNASWTLKIDLVCEYVCRLLNYMDANGYRECVPRVTDPDVTEEKLIDFNSGYVLRSLHELPKQGSKLPWKLRQNYVRDVPELRHGDLRDGSMQFSRGRAPASPEREPALAG